MIRVAIVEDNLEEQKKLFSLLEKYSLNRNCEFCFSCFVSGEDLLKQFVEHMYDLVFLDIVLPGMNGIETASIIREKDRNVILICVTTEHQYAIEGYKVELLDYLLKPVDYTQIEITICHKGFTRRKNKRKGFPMALMKFLYPRILLLRNPIPVAIMIKDFVVTGVSPWKNTQTTTVQSFLNSNPSRRAKEFRLKN
ncbi:MAG: response regulator [Clostridia bacterium]|nr:response regulator [Clostridia bacterium]